MAGRDGPPIGVYAFPMGAPKADRGTARTEWPPDGSDTVTTPDTQELPISLHRERDGSAWRYHIRLSEPPNAVYGSGFTVSAALDALGQALHARGQELSEEGLFGEEETITFCPHSTVRLGGRPVAVCDTPTGSQ